jgi:hypothetical protein
MVKKIQLVDQEPDEKSLDTADYQRQVLELLAAIDWKLWEIYKMQSKHPQEAVDDTTVTDTPMEYTPVRLDDDTE